MSLGKAVKNLYEGEAEKPYCFPDRQRVAGRGGRMPHAHPLRSVPAAEESPKFRAEVITHSGQLCYSEQQLV